jgi:hypothetical protein
MHINKQELKMFCPNCKSEYREGFSECADCGTALVSELPSDNNEDDVSYAGMVEVYSTYNQGEIAFIKSMLDAEGITYYFQGENPMMMIAAGSYARLLVQTDQADHVREILQISNDSE